MSIEKGMDEKHQCGANNAYGDKGEIYRRLSHFCFHHRDTEITELNFLTTDFKDFRRFLNNFMFMLFILRWKARLPENKKIDYSVISVTLWLRY